MRNYINNLWISDMLFLVLVWI